MRIVGYSLSSHKDCVLVFRIAVQIVDYGFELTQDKDDQLVLC